MKIERQKMISQLSVICMLRTSVPALAQQSVAPTIISSARRRAREVVISAARER
jgi:hypothetical protein